MSSRTFMTSGTVVAASDEFLTRARAPRAARSPAHGYAPRVRSVLVTGGTGGLGAAVTSTLLAEGWRVVVPWIKERELERVPEREGLELVRADLFDPADVATCVERAAAEPGAPLQGV